MATQASSSAVAAQRARLLLITAMALIGALFLSASLSASTTLMGAGDSEHAWILVIPGPDAEGDAALVRLHHAPGDATPGSLVSAQTLRRAPDFVTAGAGKLLLVYEPAEPDDSGAPVRLLRTLRVGAAIAPGAYQYEPRGRLAALPPLTGEGRLKGVVQTRTGVAVLLRSDSGAGARDRLLWCDGVEWRDTPLPEGIDPDAEWRLLLHAGAFAILELAPGRKSMLWSAASVRSPRPGDREAPAPDESEPAMPDLPESAWSSSPVAIDSEDETILSIGGSFVVVREAGAGEVVLDLVREDRRRELVRLTGIGAVRTETALGEDVMLVWIEDDEEHSLTSQLHTAVVSSVTGKVLHQGPVVRESPITVRDLTFLALLLSAVVLTVLIFVLRPEAAMRVSIVLPPGTAMAEPWMRIVAALIDFAPCVLIAGRLWAMSPGEVLFQPFGQVGEEGLLPIFTALALMCLHSTISEWLWGRTLGKAIFRCRTVSVTGRGLSLWQAAARNVVKALAPPLILLILLDPRRRHLGDLVVGSIVVARADGPGEISGADGSGGGDPDQGADDRNQRSG